MIKSKTQLRKTKKKQTLRQKMNNYIKKKKKRVQVQVKITNLKHKI